MNRHREVGSQSGDTNLFSYVANDPINFVDPRGLWGVTIGGGIGGYWGAGGDISGGVYFGYQNGSFYGGIYGSHNTGYGYGGGANAQCTAYSNVNNISGPSSSTNISRGPWSGTVVTNPNTGEVTGIGGGWGFGSPRGGSLTSGNTGTIGGSFGGNSPPAVQAPQPGLP